MKKIITLFFVFVALQVNAQTPSEIGNILNAKPVSLSTTSAAVLNADLLASIDITAFGYKTITVTTGGTFVGTVSFQGSNDNFATNTELISGYNGVTKLWASTVTVTNATFTIPIMGYTRFRVRMTAYTSGTATAIVNAYYSQLTTVKDLQAANILQINGVAPLMGNGTTGTGSQRVTLASDNTANTNPFLFEQRTTTTNGSTASFLNSAATTNATLLKATAGMVYNICVMNASAATKYLRLYNLTVAPTVGTSVPVLVIAVPATSSKEITLPVGLKFSTGISYAITGGAAVLDATAVAAGDTQTLINWQ